MGHRDELLKAAGEAYDDGNPIITDEEYDAVFGQEGPVGAGAKGDIPHMWPLWSLQNYFVGDGEPPIVGAKLVLTPKLDGAAVALVYHDGILIRALTRGDGKKGKNVFSNMEQLVPRQLPIPLTPAGFLQITGEVVAYETVENARNVAAGSLGLKSAEEFLERKRECHLEFIAYGYNSDSSDLPTYSEGLAFISTLGFDTVATCNSGLYPTDGFVYRLDDNRLYEEKGYTSKHPRGAYAEKTREVPVETELLDVIWQTGKSGKVTPVAILEEIVIDDAKITRATLNNMAYIHALGLEIGCTVKVIRAGSVIPCVIGRV